MPDSSVGAVVFSIIYLINTYLHYQNPMHTRNKDIAQLGDFFIFSKRRFAFVNSFH